MIAQLVFITGCQLVGDHPGTVDSPIRFRYRLAAPPTAVRAMPGAQKNERGL